MTKQKKSANALPGLSPGSSVPFAAEMLDSGAFPAKKFNTLLRRFPNGRRTGLRDIISGCQDVVRPTAISIEKAANHSTCSLRQVGGDNASRYLAQIANHISSARLILLRGNQILDSAFKVLRLSPHNQN